MPALLLTTLGRKTSRPYTTPLNYLLDEGVPVVTASNSGHRRPPLWWLNLQAHPRAVMQIGHTVTDVLAREADETERQRLWPKLIAQNPAYVRYTTLAGHALPMIWLEPANL